MDLSSLLNTDKPAQISALGPPCKITKVIQALPEPYKTAARDLANKTFLEGGLSEDQAAAKFFEAGIKIGHSSIGRHRKGWCTCPPNERNTNDSQPA